MILSMFMILFQSLLISLTPLKAQLTSTNLPIVILTTSGPVTTTQSQATMSIIDNSTGVNAPTDPPKFTGMVGINLRGNTSYPKNSYSIETWSGAGVSLDTALLGMPSENDWVLLAMYEDRSLLRNTLALDLHDNMDRYAARLRYCEVLLNNQYIGVYTFGEKIKRDSLRLDIAKLTPLDNSGIDLTGGYIIKIDGGGAGWTSSFAPPYGSTQQIKFEYDYPSSGDITPVQESYIKSYVDSFEAAMNASNFNDTLLGWRRHGAENSFMDFMIMQELSRNHEAYRKNTFLYKDKGTKLRPGPLWSFDLAWRNTADCNSSLDTGWCYQLGAFCASENKLVPFWWQKLSTDNQFMEDLKCRYTNYRRTGSVLDTVKIFKFIDSVRNLLTSGNAITRNFTQWPIWGVPLVNEPTPMAMDYNTEVNNLKAFIKARIAYLDSKWTSTSPTCYPTAVTQQLKESQISIYPNPFDQQLTIKADETIDRIYILNMQGQTLLEKKLHQLSDNLDLSSFEAGIYLLHVHTLSGIYVQKIVKP